MSDDSLEQPSPLRIVPSFATGGAAMSTAHSLLKYAVGWDLTERPAMTPLVKYAVHVHNLIEARGHDGPGQPFHIVVKAADVDARIAELEQRWHHACTHDYDISLLDQVTDLTAQLATVTQESDEWHVNATHHYEAGRILKQQLATARQTVWEEVIAEVSRNETVSPFIGPLWNSGWTDRSTSLLKWCREQAKKGEQ